MQKTLKYEVNLPTWFGDIELNFDRLIQVAVMMMQVTGVDPFVTHYNIYMKEPRQNALIYLEMNIGTLPGSSEVWMLVWSVKVI